MLRVARQVRAIAPFRSIGQFAAVSSEYISGALRTSAQLLVESLYRIHNRQEILLLVITLRRPANHLYIGTHFVHKKLGYRGMVILGFDAEHGSLIRSSPRRQVKVNSSVVWPEPTLDETQHDSRSIGEAESGTMRMYQVLVEGEDIENDASRKLFYSSQAWVHAGCAPPPSADVGDSGDYEGSDRKRQPPLEVHSSPTPGFDYVLHEDILPYTPDRPMDFSAGEYQHLVHFIPTAWGIRGFFTPRLNPLVLPLGILTDVGSTWATVCHEGLKESTLFTGRQTLRWTERALDVYKQYVQGPPSVASANLKLSVFPLKMTKSSLALAELVECRGSSGNLDVSLVPVKVPALTWDAAHWWILQIRVENTCTESVAGWTDETRGRGLELKEIEIITTDAAGNDVVGRHHMSEGSKKRRLDLGMSLGGDRDIQQQHPEAGTWRADEGDTIQFTVRIPLRTSEGHLSGKLLFSPAPEENFDASTDLISADIPNTILS